MIKSYNAGIIPTVCNSPINYNNMCNFTIDYIVIYDVRELTRL